MKNIVIIFLLIIAGKGFSQSQCPNADFSQLNFTNWVTETGTCCPVTITPTAPGTQLTIITTPGIDPNTCGGLQMIPPGFSQSCRIGDGTTAGYGAAGVSYSFTVTTNNALFIYDFAVVLQDPGHPPAQQPRFQIQVLDQNNNVVPCTFYNIVASGSIPGFQNCGIVRWRDWTKVGIDLTPLMGQNITITAQSGDCGAGGHYGYGYIVAQCSPLVILAARCWGDTLATLTAPSGFSTYQWSTGETTQQIVVDSSNFSSTITCIITSVNGCQSTLTANLSPTISHPDFGFNIGCGGTVQFTDSSTIQNDNIIGWHWDFGDGDTSNLQNPIHSYTNPGNYNVKLTILTQDNCPNDTTISITIPPNGLFAGFNAATVCEGNVTNFNNTSTGAATSWSWDFGDGNNSNLQNPTHTYASGGKYNVQLIISNGACNDTISDSVTVNPLPTPNFTVTPACPGSATQFNNTTPNNNTYQWDFGDGVGTSTTQNPTYSYTSGGTYTVQLIATSDSGCVDSISIVDTIPYLPIAVFGFDTVCIGDSTCFADSSTVQNSTITSWTWSWGDGAPVGNTQNPCHLYAPAGNYTVIMTPTSAEGCTAPTPATHQITVNTDPIASFTVNNVCQYDAAVFNNTSVNNTINSWTLGDGNTSTAVNPSHQYANSGSYNVQLIISSGGGCSDTVDTSVTIYPVPTAGFSFTNVCDGDSMNFTNTSTIGGGGSISNYGWNFGDGSGISTQSSPSYLYAGDGQYNVTLITTSSYNCMDTITQQITIYPLPVADFTPTQVCLNTATVFTDQSTVSSGSITQWYWNFGDIPPGTSYQQTPTYTYNSVGTFNAALAISTNNGCVDTITKPVTVNPNPVADFISNNRKGCTPWCVNFTDSSNISSGSITNWAWDFGNGTTQNTQNSVACYENAGLEVDNYTITLTVTSDKGCTDTETKNNYVSIYPRPIAAFTMDPNPGDIWHTKIHFMDESQGASVWAWNLGDGKGTSTLQNPVYVYSDTGTYIVSLNIINQWGCTDSTSNFLRINPKYAIFIPNAFTPNYHDGHNDYFSIKGFGIRNIEMNIFNRWGNLIYSESNFNPQWNGTYKDKLVPLGVYVYKIIVTDVFNDEHTYIGSVSVVR